MRRGPPALKSDHMPPIMTFSHLSRSIDSVILEDTLDPPTMAAMEFLTVANGTVSGISNSFASKNPPTAGSRNLVTP